MSNHVSFISDLTQFDYDNIEVGNKAANLTKLIQYKFSVPNGFVIKTNAYDEFVRYNNLDNAIQESLAKIVYDNYESIGKCSQNIQKSIENSEFPSKIVNELELKYKDFSSYDVAVRSSATAEDLPFASFAGQYDTYLNLRDFTQILKYIKRCYASLWTNRAITYRHTNKIPHEKVKIAIVIQRMISAKSAGVLFTLNPISSKKDELLIESNFGLGESIVSGKINPDQYLLRRLKSGSVSILNRRIGRKRIATYPKSKGTDGGIEYRELSEDLTQQSSLSDSDILKLAEIGLQIEKKFKKIPQDIEWAIDQDDKVNILQTRPITSFKAEDITSEILWSRGYSDDYWNDNVTPLYFELLGDHITKIVNVELNDIMGYKRMDSELLKLYKSHVYFNLKVIKRKIENEIPKFIRNEDVLNYFPEGSGPYGKITMRNLPFHIISRIVAELRIGSFDPNGAMSKTAEAYENWNQKSFIPYCKKFEKSVKEFNDPKDLIRLVEELDRIMITHFRLIRYGIPVHNIGMNLLVQYLLSRFIGKEECYQLYPILISGLKNKLTETNDQIHNLASLINKSPELKSIFITKDSSEIFNTLSSKKDPSILNFLGEFNIFLNEHGVRGFTREIYYPRWQEPPMKNVFDILKSLIIDKWEELDTLKTKNLKKRERAELIVESKIRSQRFGMLKWKILSIILKNSRKYISFRENQRYNLDKWITMNRNAFLKIGKNFTEREIIPDENKIFFLRKQEIKNLIFSKYSTEEIQQISSEATKRYEDFERYENIIPPKFLLGSREFDDQLHYDDNSRIFNGLPASQGIITAPIRIIHDINLISTVRSGEILVVPQTDPGWTPVFSKIGGLITETGGILSHGAVVSREFGIPAVTNITNASKIFKTGQIVKINGYNGTVVPQNLNERG
jgi:pyruvate,water dikinase